MAYQDIPENPQFNNQIRKIETTDLVHADIMNEILSKMLESDVFLKAFAEGLAAKVQEHAEKKEIHVTATDKTAWNETYQQSTGYTDQKIAELINGAPETLDTLKEIADAMAENNTVVEALDTAIGKKADAAEFETLQKKYYSMVGNNDISSIGDGTLTGAVSSLNTDTNLQKPTSGTYLCFFKAVDGARVVLFIPLTYTAEANKKYELGDIRVWANNPMGTQGVFTLTGRGKNGLCFESTHKDVVYQFSTILNNHMYPGTAELIITP